MYTNEKHALILLSLLKQHNIKKIVVSPGSTNIPISTAVQSDDFFDVYSCVDERSAAYIAIGLSQNSSEPVAISCTGATASRNYMSALTEAYYRKLPIISITSFNGNENIGHLVAQNLDRRVMPNDTVRLSVQVPYVYNSTSEWECNTLINKALIECRKDGGGPVNINIGSLYSNIFDTKHLPKTRLINFANKNNISQFITKVSSVAIFIGSNKEFSKEETKLIENFCKKYNGVVFCDHTSGYYGEFKILGSLVCSNFGPTDSSWNLMIPELMIHIGEVSGDYAGMRVINDSKRVWRVSEDGEIRDLTKKLELVFKGDLKSFFKNVSIEIEPDTESFYNIWKNSDEKFRDEFKNLNLPFSNLWIASEIYNRFPEKSILNFAILNSLRTWNFFKLHNSIRTFCNVGGFGIDGCLSTSIGGALAKKNHMHFLIIGDLAFFYDINAILNRHFPKNLRIILINNGGGIEFKNYSHMASEIKIDANELIAAGGHFNSGTDGKSKISTPEIRSKNSLARAWCDKLDIDYFSAFNKEEFKLKSKSLFDYSSNKSLIFEIFTNDWEESLALKIASNFKKTNTDKLIQEFKGVLPANYKNYLKKVFGR